MANENEAILFDNLTDEEFHALIDDMIYGTTEESTGGWRITNDSAADWAVQKVKEEEAEYKRLYELGNEQIEKIQERLEAAERRMESRTSFLRGKLSEYFHTVPHRETKTQEKYQLLSGCLVMNREKVTIEKGDPDLLLQYLKDNHYTELIKTKEEPVWGEFKKQLVAIDGKVIDEATGAVVECVNANTKPATFEVK